jgi:hypothetical protein
MKSTFLTDHVIKSNGEPLCNGVLHCFFSSNNYKRWGNLSWVFILFTYVSYLSFGHKLFLGTEFTVTQY